MRVRRKVLTSKTYWNYRMTPFPFPRASIFVKSLQIFGVPISKRCSLSCGGSIPSAKSYRKRTPQNRAVLRAVTCPVCASYHRSKALGVLGIGHNRTSDRSDQSFLWSPSPPGEGHPEAPVSTTTDHVLKCCVAASMLACRLRIHSPQSSMHFSCKLHMWDMRGGVESPHKRSIIRYWMTILYYNYLILTCTYLSILCQDELSKQTGAQLQG